MESILSCTVFNLIDPPHVRITRPSWMQVPSGMTIFGIIMLTYFIVTAGTIYDVINEPPSIGSIVDERGHQRPVAIMANRVNGQYIMEGLAASFMFTLGGLGFIILDRCHNPQMSGKQRLIFLGFGFFAVGVAFVTTRAFMSIKMPSYGM